MALSREEITNTVQQLVGPGFKVELSWNELDYLSKLKDEHLELGILKETYQQLLKHGASSYKLFRLEKQVAEVADTLVKKTFQNSKLKSLQSDVHFKGLYTEKKNNVVAIDTINKFYPNKSAMDEFPWDYNATLQVEQQQSAVSYLLGAIGVNGSVAGSALQGLQGDTNGNLQTERKNTRKNTLPPVTGRKFRE
jgi:hypothetical protein